MMVAIVRWRPEDFLEFFLIRSGASRAAPLFGCAGVVCVTRRKKRLTQPDATRRNLTQPAGAASGALAGGAGPAGCGVDLPGVPRGAMKLLDLRAEMLQHDGNEG